VEDEERGTVETHAAQEEDDGRVLN